MNTAKQPDPGLDLDPFSLVGTTVDGAWTITVRAIASPTGLKVWSLKIEPKDRVAGDPPPNDAPGAGINTGVLKKISFPEIRSELTRRTDAHLARVLAELEQASPENRAIIESEIARARGEKSRSTDPTIRRGRTPTDGNQRAQWALDVLEFKGRPSYRKQLRNLWSEREQKPSLKLKTVDTRMGRLKDDGWLIGYGGRSMKGPQLQKWQDEHGTEYWKRENSHGKD